MAHTGVCAGERLATLTLSLPPELNEDLAMIRRNVELEKRG